MLPIILKHLVLTFYRNFSLNVIYIEGHDNKINVLWLEVRVSFKVLTGLYIFLKAEVYRNKLRFSEDQLEKLFEVVQLCVNKLLNNLFSPSLPGCFQNTLFQWRMMTFM